MKEVMRDNQKVCHLIADVVSTSFQAAELLLWSRLPCANPGKNVWP